MMAIGVGARSVASVEDIAEAVAAAEARAGRRANVVVAPDAMPFMETVKQTATQAGYLFRSVSLDALKARSAECQTRSERTLALYGVSSIAEAAALFGAGPGSRLILPRLAFARTTVAAAVSADELE